MKEYVKNEAVKTIPDGVWESTHPDRAKTKNNKCSVSTDLQGNGYPDNTKTGTPLHNATKKEIQ